MTYDIVIQGGTVVDGSGSGRFRADVGIIDGRIATIGRITDPAKEVVDADGLFVTPGFVDNHTHLDAQVCWDPFGPAAPHGVTSVVMGNCGIGVAPVHDEAERDLFIMPALEIAEDIHRPTIEAGVEWNWQTFPEYLDVLRALPKGINFGVNVGHGALRTYVLGERVFEKDAATDDEIAAMCHELEAARRAGALGFSSMLEGASLFSLYGPDVDVRDMDPRVVCAMSSRREVEALAEVLARTGGGAIQLGGAHWVDAVRLSAIAGLPLQYVFGTGPMTPAFTLQHYEDATAAGANMIAAISARPQTSLMGFRARLPFDSLPMWRELRATPFDEQRTALRDPQQRAQLLDIARNGPYPQFHGLAARPPDWERMSIIDRRLPPYPTVAEVAAERGVDPYDLFVDLSLESDFHQLFSQPVTVNYDREVWLEMFRHPRSVISLADTGAHTAQALDWATPAFFLGYWVRQEQEFTWEQGVRMFTFDPASVWGGLGGRGLLREGYVADVNVFDPETFAPEIPDADDGLPAGGKRLTCDPVGMHATLVGGEIVFRDGKHTGALPGTLLTNGAQRTGAA